MASAAASSIESSELDRPTMPLPGNRSRGIRNSPAYLSFLFFISFAIPVLTVLHLNGLFDPASFVAPGSDERFPNSLAVAPADMLVRVSHSEVLNPTADRDLLFTSWIKLRRLPNPGERGVLYAKQDQQSSQAIKPGFGLGLANDAGVLRPMVYWNSKDGARWFKFEELPVPPTDWVMFALSLRGGRSLGLHVAIPNGTDRPEIRLLGGYDLGEWADVPNLGDLVFAPMGATRLVGRIGPTGIFRLKDLTDSLRDLIKDFSRVPLELPSSIKEREVMLWWPEGLRDRSQFEHKITVVRDLRAAPRRPAKGDGHEKGTKEAGARQAAPVQR